MLKKFILSHSIHYEHTVLLIDQTVGQIYKREILSLGLEVILIPSGETSKSRKMKAEIEDKLFVLGCSRNSLLVAIGGGVVLDLVGFIAATYMRGIDFISVPTTLLSMVDASIGGKCSINTSEGKNLLGLFYLPKDTLIDVSFLSSLPKVEILEGVAEMIKHGFLGEGSIIRMLNNKKKVVSLDPPFMDKLIAKNRQFKRSVVALDEKDRDMRQILNFGHTIGHAVEIASQYEVSHGRSVCFGMLKESLIAQELGFLKREHREQIIRMIDLFDIAIDIDDILEKDHFYEALAMDKKNSSRDKIAIVIPNILKTTDCRVDHIEAKTLKSLIISI